MEQIIVQVAAMAGFAALITLLVNVGKVIGWVKEDMALVVSSGANLILILVVYGFQLFRPDFNFGTLDPIMAQAALVGNLVLTYVIQLMTSKVTHETVRGLPIIGKSFSFDREEAFENNLG